MNLLGLGLTNVGHYEDALPVQEAEMAMLQRLGAPEEELLVTQDGSHKKTALCTTEESAYLLRPLVRFPGVVGSKGIRNGPKAARLSTVGLVMRQQMRDKTRLSGTFVADVSAAQVHAR